MKLYILGAGASKSYNSSFSGQQMPIANDFFRTFNKMKNLTESPWVLVGPIINALQRLKGVTAFDPFKDDFDIEEIHSLVEKKMFEAIEKDNLEESMLYSQAYSGLIFLFSVVVNDIANGPLSEPHKKLVDTLNSDDAIITFNWDTLLDRALFESQKWNFNGGYFVTPKAVFNDRWESLKSTENSTEQPLLLKMHGSANWLTGYYTLNLHTKKLEFRHDLSPETFFVYQHSMGPYPCYDGRWEKTYQPFSYGYYPPNLNEGFQKIDDDSVGVFIKQRSPYHAPKGSTDSSGLPSMPVIIPPVKYKTYDFFGSLFDQIWTEADRRIQTASSITLIGYSFPVTDIKSKQLFVNAMMKRTTIPHINIVDPKPERIRDIFVYELGIPDDNITVFKDYFSETFDFKRLK